MKLRLPGKTTRTVDITKGKSAVKRLKQTEESNPEPPGIHARLIVKHGLTIPGPKNSFMGARLDYGLDVPCGLTEDDIRRVRAQAKSLIQDFLEEDAAEVQEFFDSL